MHADSDLERFVAAQAMHYERALSEIRFGRKRSHWMWFIFPQLRGLGRSERAHFYGLADLDEAARYYAHDVLGERLEVCAEVVLRHRDRTAFEMLGTPDDAKLRSCMTLFSRVADVSPIYAEVIDAFFGGHPDPATLRRLGAEPRPKLPRTE